MLNTESLLCYLRHSRNSRFQVSDILHFFPQEKPGEISFLTSSEKSGYSHLYYVTSSLTQSVISSNDGAFDMNDKPNGNDFLT